MESRVGDITKKTALPSNVNTEVVCFYEAVKQDNEIAKKSLITRYGKQMYRALKSDKTGLVSDTLNQMLQVAHMLSEQDKATDKAMEVIQAAVTACEELQKLAADYPWKFKDKEQKKLLYQKWSKHIAKSMTVLHNNLTQYYIFKEDWQNAYYASLTAVSFWSPLKPKILGAAEKQYQDSLKEYEEELKGLSFNRDTLIKIMEKEKVEGSERFKLFPGTVVDYATQPSDESKQAAYITLKF